MSSFLNSKHEQMMYVWRYVYLLSVFSMKSLRTKVQYFAFLLHFLRCPLSKNNWRKVRNSDGTFLYPYDTRMCYFDTLIEKF